MELDQFIKNAPSKDIIDLMEDLREEGKVKKIKKNVYEVILGSE